MHNDTEIDLGGGFDDFDEPTQEQTLMSYIDYLAADMMNCYGYEHPQFTRQQWRNSAETSSADATSYWNWVAISITDTEDRADRAMAELLATGDVHMLHIANAARHNGFDPEKRNHEVILLELQSRGYDVPSITDHNGRLRQIIATIETVACGEGF